MIIIIMRLMQLCDRNFNHGFCTKLRRFAKSLPICAVGAWVYADALRAFAREILLVHERNLRFGSNKAEISTSTENAA